MSSKLIAECVWAKSGDLVASEVKVLKASDSVKAALWDLGDGVVPQYQCRQVGKILKGFCSQEFQFSCGKGESLEMDEMAKDIQECVFIHQMKIASVKVQFVKEPIRTKKLIFFKAGFPQVKAQLVVVFQVKLRHRNSVVKTVVYIQQAVHVNRHCLILNIQYLQASNLTEELGSHRGDAVPAEIQETKIW
jgi:hypothetical protein